MVCSFSEILRAVSSLLKRFFFACVVTWELLGNICWGAEFPLAGEAEVVWVLWQVPSQVCVSNVLSSPGVVEIYDSMLFYTTKSTALHIQVAKIMKTKEKSFMLKHVDVQRQSGASSVHCLL